MSLQQYQEVCLNGHQKTIYSKTIDNPGTFCEECGESIISQCLNCKAGIKGFKRVPGVISIGENIKVPRYCYHCSKPFPWTQILISNTEELLSLDPAFTATDINIAIKAIPDLISETPTTPVATIKFKQILSKATPVVKDAMYNLLVDVISETVKKSLF